MIRKKWVSDNSKSEYVKELARELNENESFIRILVQRGADTKEKIENFLKPSLNNLYDPFILKDMDKAVLRIREALNKNEKICIYGDYDVDGVTAVTILYKFLKEKSENIITYIPDRENEGYGVNNEAILSLSEENVDLLITVDCGITSVSEVEYAKELGMDVIVTDHHTCPDILPRCVAVINPKRRDGDYPFSELCGAGVAYKLVTAFNENVSDEIKGIAALGTVADIVPLLSENRIIVSDGLKYIRNGKVKGISALCKVAGIDVENIDSQGLGFQIAPRINAAGRMNNSKDALMVFNCSSDEVDYYAQILNKRNIERKEKEQEIYKIAVKQAEKCKNDEVIVVVGENFHEGVIGIVASKICDLYYKPCIMISLSDNVGKASSRSIKSFDIYKALNNVSELLVKFGGHELAAGFTIEKDKIELFKERINEYAKEIFEEKRPSPELFIDAKIKKEDMTEEFVRKIKSIEPFGMGNNEPVFVSDSLKVVKSIGLKDNKHLKLVLLDMDKELEGIGFGMGNFVNSLKYDDNILVAGNIGINEFKGNKKFNIKIKDIRKSGIN